MSARAPSGTAPARPEGRTLSDAAVKAVAGWVSQLQRTLKTCRLYDAGNPTVVRFREELFTSLERLLGEHGAFELRFAAEDVTCDGVSQKPARSREDNLAFVFHRDGVRGLGFQPGVRPPELTALVDATLAVSGQNLVGDDLVTLLWEADLRAIEIDYIPAEGDLGGESGPDAADAGGPLLPWPTPAAEPEPAPAGPDAGEDGPERSEDWKLGDLTVEVEATFAELDALAPVEVERFRHEYEAEHRVPLVTAANAIAHACLHADADDGDRQELGRFLPRVLRGALTAGRWADALDTLRLVRGLHEPSWSEETFAQELLQPVSIQRAVEQLDGQALPQLAEFVALTLEVGDPGLDWMMLTLCESQRQEVRLALAESLSQRCQDHPERLAPWLSDPRWYVVRNVVTILGWIGGAAVAGLLQAALRHPDARVHAAVVQALQHVDLRHARPVLVRALDGADTPMFVQVLHQLSGGRDPATARFVFGFVQQDRFLERPAEERRAVYAAIASVGGDELVHELEAELLRGPWFDREREIHRHAMARCLALIATPQAVIVLQRGAQSRRDPVRLACQSALHALESR
jgi:HEAT repeat protein